MNTDHGPSYQAKQSSLSVCIRVDPWFRQCVNAPPGVAIRPGSPAEGGNAGWRSGLVDRGAVRLRRGRHHNVVEAHVGWLDGGEVHHGGHILARERHGAPFNGTAGKNRLKQINRIQMEHIP